MKQNRSMPDCPVIPVISCADVAGKADWLEQAFGFSRRVTIGDHRIQMNAGEGAIVLAHGGKAAAGVSIMVRTSGVDLLHVRASASGAKVVLNPTTFAYGERQCSIEDAEGLVWTFSETVGDVAPEEWGGVSAG